MAQHHKQYTEVIERISAMKEGWQGIQEISKFEATIGPRRLHASRADIFVPETNADSCVQPNPFKPRFPTTSKHYLLQLLAAKRALLNSGAVFGTCVKLAAELEGVEWQIGA